MMGGGQQGSGMMNGTSPHNQNGSGSSGAISGGESSGQQANAGSSLGSESTTESDSGTPYVSGTDFGAGHNSSSNFNGNSPNLKVQFNISWVVCLVSVIGGAGLLIVGVVAAGLILWCCWCRVKRSPHTARIGQIQSSGVRCTDETNRVYAYAIGFKNAGITEPNEKYLKSDINKFNEAQLKAPEASPPPAYSSVDFSPNADLGAKHPFVAPQYH